MKTLLNSLLLCAFSVFPAVAGTQETVEVQGIYEIEINSELSPREAMDRAYKEAQKDALQKVVGLEVKSWEASVLDSEAGTGFTSLNLQTTQGIIRKFDVKNSGWKILPAPGEPQGILRFFCHAKALVEKIDDEPDPEFSGKITGARADYRDGERVKFSAVASQDAFLTVFLLNSRLEGDKIFPNRTFRKNRLSADEAIALPPFTLMKTKPGNAREQAVLMFVFTKKNIAFFAKPNGKTTADEINTWLADIPADQRFFKVFPFSLAPEGETLP